MNFLNIGVEVRDHNSNTVSSPPPPPTTTTTQIMDEEEENIKVLSERLLDHDEENEYSNNMNYFDHLLNSSSNNEQQQQQSESIGEIVVDGSAAAGIGGGVGSGGFGSFSNTQAQAPEYRDASFAIAFLFHILVILGFAVAWGIPTLMMTSGQQQEDENEDENNYANDDDDNSNNNTGSSSSSSSSSYRAGGLLWLCLFTCIISIGISTLALQVMMYRTEMIIQSSLIGSCCVMVLISISFLMDQLWIGGTIWIIILLITMWYAKSVWNRIPFAASNLRTALSAVQTNGGICIVAYGIAFLAMVWTMLWFVAFIGVSVKESSSCNNNVSGSSSGAVCTPNMNFISILLLVVSFYWTSQVLQNILHVVVAGVVGTWWFDPQDALSVFSPAILDSFRRATTYSFGSICMGSLLVAIIQAMEALARSARRNNHGGIFLCIIECILRMISRIAIYFNKWAYCYVGLYGSDYISSGKKAMELFQARGWNTIITDDLIHRSLALVAIVIGAVSGVLGMVVAKATGYTLMFTTTILNQEGEGGSSTSSANGMIFFVCFTIGISMAFILMKVVLSAVDTVIVAFAEAPAEFNTHHPALYNNMVQKWRMVYPEECGF